MSEEEQPGQDVLVVLTSVPAGIAQVVCAALESEGIACELFGETGTSGNGHARARVLVLVHEADLVTAQQVLNRPGDALADDPEEQAERECHLAANWVCPNCRHRALRLLPPPIAWRVLRYFALFLTVLPIAFQIVVWALPLDSLMRIADDAAQWWIAVWMGAAIILVLAFALSRRDKLCQWCGWRSGQAAGESYRSARDIDSISEN